MSFTADQCEKIRWVCLDINAKDVKQVLASHLSSSANDTKRGFDTISLSYSISMIPDWQTALLSAKSLMSVDGRVIVSDFDTYTEEGKSIKDWCIRTWYAQDSVRIDAKTRQFIKETVFPSDEFTVTLARFEKKFLKVSIPHYVACCRKGTITTPEGFRRPSNHDLTKMYSNGEEKKDN